MAEKFFLTAAELVERWDGLVTVNTLAQWRSEKKGPPYKKVGGKVVYQVEEIKQYERSGTIYPE